MSRSSTSGARFRRLSPTFVGLLVMVAGALPAAAQSLVDPVVTRNPRYPYGDVRWLQAGSPDHGISGVAWDERHDKPCYMIVKRKSLTTGVEQNGESINLCGGGFNPPSFTDMVQTRGSGRGVHFAGAPRKFLNALTSCLSGTSGNLKGLRIAAAVVSPASANPHEVDPLNGNERAEQRACRYWDDELRCPADHIASAVIVRHDDDEIFELGLRCKRVVW